MLEEQKEGKNFQPSAMKEESFNTKKMRLQEPADFKKTFKAGNKIFSKCVILWVQAEVLSINNWPRG